MVKRRKKQQAQIEFFLAIVGIAPRRRLVRRLRRRIFG